MSGPLDNPQHEAIARHYVCGTGKKKRWEIVQAVYGCAEKTARNQSITIFRQADFKRRVAELQENLADHDLDRGLIERDWLLTEAKSRYEECKAEGDRGNAIKLLELMGREAKGGAVFKRETVSRKIVENHALAGKSAKDSAALYERAVQALQRSGLPEATIKEMLGVRDAARGSGGDPGGGDEVPPSGALPTLQ